MRLTGVVLAGGQSRRMGRPKALLEFEGQTLIARACAALAPVCEEILVVMQPSQRATLRSVLDFPLIDDPPAARGPLAGIKAGLEAASSLGILVVGCDMPQLDPAALQLVSDQDSAWDVVIPVVDGHRQPLHARYLRGCLPAIDRVLARGAGPVDTFFDEVQVLELTEEVWGPVPGFRDSVLSLDTDQDWQGWLKGQD